MHKNPCPESWGATGRRAFEHGVVMGGAALLLSACAFKHQPSPEQVKAREAHMARVQQAQARFTELCKTAGITVNRRVTGVKGVRLERVPAKSRWTDWIDPMWPEAALGSAGGGALFEELLKRRVVDPLTGRLRGDVTSRDGGEAFKSVPGFEYLDVQQPDGRWTRFHSGLDGSLNFSMSSNYIDEKYVSPYAVTYDLKVDANDRQLWIAGVVIQVKDVRSGELLGSVVRYVWDQGMGDAQGGRSAWLFAAGSNTCPSMKLGNPSGYFMFFIDSIVTPGD